MSHLRLWKENEKKGGRSPLYAILDGNERCKVDERWPPKGKFSPAVDKPPTHH